MITDATRIRRSPRAAAHGLGETEGGVVLHLESGQYHGLNSVAWAIWNLLGEPREVAAVVTEVQALFPEAGPQAHDDVHAFVASLIERDLVEVVV
jgi:hypothetical protein